MSDDYELHVPALSVEQPIGEFFIAAISVKKLVEISYTDVRRLANEKGPIERYLGIQRNLSKTRVNKIKKYLEGSDATFPTSVILAVDERCATYDASKCMLILSPYTPDDESEDRIPYERIANILDGQHRIAAFLDKDHKWDSAFDDMTFELNVAIFVGADISEQANIFATVNLAQTKVNRSLVYDLTELANSRSPFRTCHNVAVALDSEKSSPLHHRIKRLGVATPGRRKEPLTQAGFVESLVRFISKHPVDDRNKLLDGESLKPVSTDQLVDTPFRNMFIEGNDLDIAEILYNYFSAVEKRWPHSWNEIETTGNLLPRSNAFKALMKYLKEDVYPDIAGDRFGMIPSQKEFEPYFADLDLDDTDFTTKNFVPGSGGQSVFLKLLRGQMKIDELIDEAD